MKTLFATIILLYCACTNLFTQQGVEFSTDYKIGEQLPRYDKKYYDLKVLIFVDELSCITCIESMKNVSEYIMKNSNAQIVLFFIASSDNYLDKYINKIDWKYDAVHDFAGAYKNLFKIKEVPFMFITNNSGVIYYMGIPGSAKYFDIDSIQNAVELIKHKKNELFSAIGLKEIDKKPVNNSKAKQILINQPFSAHENLISKNIVVSSLEGNALYLLDSNANLLADVGLDKFGLDRHTMVHGNLKNEEAYIYTVSQNGINTIHEVDIKEKKIIFSLKCEPRLDENTLPFFNVHKYNDNTFFINQKTYNYSGRSEAEPTIRSYSSNSSNSLSFGTLANTYNDYYLSNYVGSDFCFDNNSNIYEIQNFSDSLNIYNINSNNKKSIKINFDTTKFRHKWRDCFKGVSDETDIELIKNLRYKISSRSYNHAIFYDNAKDNIYIVYHNRNENNDLDLFIHKMSVNVNAKKYEIDIIIPPDSIIISINNGVLKLLQTIENKSYVIDYCFINE